MDLTKLKTNFILIEEASCLRTWLLHLQYTYILFFMDRHDRCVNVVIHRKKGGDGEIPAFSFRPSKKTRDCSAVFAELYLSLSLCNPADNKVIQAYLEDLNLLIAQEVIEIKDLWI